MSTSTLSYVYYDDALGTLTLEGTGLTLLASDYNLEDLTLTGEGGASYTLQSSPTFSGTPSSTSVSFQLSGADLVQVPALLGLAGTPGVVTASAGWDTPGSASASTFAVLTPTLTVNTPSPVAVLPGVTTAITGVSLSETSAVSGEPLVVRVDEDKGGALSTTANEGTVTFPVAGSTSSIAFLGTLDQINADLAGLTDTALPGAANSSTGLTIGAEGAFGDTASGSVEITAVTPSLTVNTPAPVAVLPGVTTAITGISLSETPTVPGEAILVRVDEDKGGSLATTADQGTITFPVGGSTSSIAFLGTLDEINADLAGLTDTAQLGAANSSTGLTIGAVGSFGEIASGNVAITAVTPTLTVNTPSPVTITAGVTTPIVGISLSETPTVPGEAIVVQVDEDRGGSLATTADQGTITFPVGGSTSSIAFLGTLDQINADLAGLTDTAQTGAANSSTGLTIGAVGSFEETALGNVAINAACYVRGARIETSHGMVPIENLAIGDCVVTASGSMRPIRWIGWRGLDCSRHPEPQAVWPVRVRAHAFGEGWPRRDLWLSPGHNVAWNGVLMPISALINGQSVVQVEQANVEYWHIELDDHDIIIAEGMPSESYLDTGNRAAFANGGAFVQAHPDFRPKHWAETCLPLVMQGSAIAAVKAHLLARLCELGYSINAEADAHILFDGRRIEPIRLSERRLAFVLPEGGRQITLCSNSFVPAHTAADNLDARLLGLCVGRLQVDGHRVAIDEQEDCGSGWHAPEFDRGSFARRWTRGAAPLPPGSRFVIVDLAGVGSYWRTNKDGGTALFA